MGITSIRGLSGDVVVRRHGPLVTEDPSRAINGRNFRSKLADAGKRMSEPELEPGNRRHNDRRTSRRQEPAVTRSSVTAHPTASGGTGRSPTVAQLQRHAATVADLTRRRRRFKTTTPKSVRCRIMQQMQGLGLTLVDLWSDPEKCTVTLVVDQAGFAETRFVIEHDKSVWRIAIYSFCNDDIDNLLHQQDALQTRFDAVDLGEITLSLAPG